MNYFNIISDDEISVSHSRECHSPGYVWSKVQPKLTLRDKHANKAYALSFLNILALTLCNPVYLYNPLFYLMVYVDLEESVVETIFSADVPAFGTDKLHRRHCYIFSFLETKHVASVPSTQQQSNRS